MLGFSWQSQKEARVFAVICALLSVVSVAPFWLVLFQPLYDLSCHLAALAVWTRYNDPSFDVARYYTLSLGAAPYWLYYGLVRGFALLCSVDIANRIVLSIYALSVPGTLLLLCRRFERSPWLCLFGFPLLWNYNLTMGFIPLCLGFSVAFWGIAVYDSFCERPTFFRAMGASLLGILTFFSHLLPWGLFLATTGLIGLLHRGRGITRLALRLAVLLPALAIGLYVIRRGQTLHLAHVTTRLSMVMQPMALSLEHLPGRVLSIFVTHEDELFSVLMLGSWLALKATQRSWTFSLHDLRPFACFLVPAVAYFVLPRSIMLPAYWWGINLRFAAPAALMMALCISGPIVGWRRWLLAPVVLAGFGFAGASFYHWHQQNRYLAGITTLGRLPEPGARVLVLSFPPYLPIRLYPERNDYMQRAPSSLYQSFFGGYNPYNFDEGFPLRYRVRYPAPPVAHPELFDYPRHAPYYDYLLVFQGNPDRLFGSHLDEVTHVADAGYWTLWRLPGPRTDMPSGPAYYWSPSATR